MTDPEYRHSGNAFLVGAVGFVAGIVITVFGTAVAVAIAVGFNTSFSVPTIFEATSDSGGFAVATGPGIAIVPLLIACGAFVIAAVRSKRMTRR